MNWFNYYGIIILSIMMVPNIIDAKLNPEHFENSFNNKWLEYLEQIGRIGTFIFMFITIPFLSDGFWFDKGELVYITINAILLIIYIGGWILFKEQSVKRAYLLSVTPSVIFIYSGIITRNYPLIIFSILFAICHIRISVINARNYENRKLN